MEWRGRRMVGPGADLNRFFTALLDGRLLPPAQSAEMKTVRTVDEDGGMAYGLGLATTAGWVAAVSRGFDNRNPGTGLA
ncbi:hypothetical protein [Nocardia sp. CC201C]|uniref:hypothetical protein n=1 Tax=Nocardia sp. CC201C TaxID=3044575 RepID=UPI0024A7F4F8|nr:hypothetical protein [Nocardia sp. CC201C]